jgi:hypothetical protein
VSNSSVIVGFTISPTHISAVKISTKDFLPVSHAQQALPLALISPDGKQIMKKEQLVSIIEQMMTKIGYPKFSDPVYLTISVPVLMTHQVELFEAIPAFRAELENGLAQTMLKEQNPLLQFSVISQEYGSSARVAYAVEGEQAIKEYSELFYEAGVRLKGIEIIPLSVLRGLAASGVLDAVTRTIGVNNFWGCLGISGSQTWCSLWQGKALVQIGSFSTPPDKVEWETAINNFARQAGVAKPALWLAWKDPAAIRFPADLLKLTLNGPIREAFLGPLYGHPSEQPTLSSVGVALKEVIPFPLPWDFLADQGLAEFKRKLAVPPIHNYDSYLLKFFFQVAMLIFMMSFWASLFFWLHNQVVTSGKEAQVRMMLSKISHQEQIYPDLFALVNRKTPEGIQIESLQINDSGQFSISGKSYNQKIPDQFLTSLKTPETSDTLQLKILSQSVHPSVTEPGKFQFDFAAQVQDSSPKLGEKL